MAQEEDLRIWLNLGQPLRLANAQISQRAMNFVNLPPVREQTCFLQLKNITEEREKENMLEVKKNAARMQKITRRHAAYTGCLLHTCCVTQFS